MILEINTTL